MFKKGDEFIELFCVDERVYSLFIEAFNDRNPLHTNSAFAQEKKFTDKVMHGNILGGFLSFFIGECLPLKNIIIHSQDIKYCAPVYMNDKLKLKVEVDDFFESVQTVLFKFVYENGNNRIVAKGKIQIGII